jgi:hypothetical protein
LAEDVARREGLEDVKGFTTCFQDLLRFDFFGDDFGDLTPGEKDALRKKALRRYFDK